MVRVHCNMSALLQSIQYILIVAKVVVLEWDCDLKKCQDFPSPTNALSTVIGHLYVPPVCWIVLKFVRSPLRRGLFAAEEFALLSLWMGPGQELSEGPNVLFCYTSIGRQAGFGPDSLWIKGSYQNLFAPPPDPRTPTIAWKKHILNSSSTKL